jgi:hypothetical protein
VVSNKKSKSYKKGNRTTLTKAINRNIEGMMAQRAASIGSKLKVVARPAETAVKARRLELLRSMENK